MTAYHLLNALIAREDQHATNVEKTKELWRKFGLQVRKERKRLGIRLNDFAKQLGVSGAMVSYMESGAREWNEERARKAVEILTQ